MAKKKGNKRYVILSPDGFTIHPTDTYKDKDEAIKAFEEWKERYKAQGYYSCRGERIPLNELQDRCSFVEAKDKYKDKTFAW